MKLAINVCREDHKSFAKKFNEGFRERADLARWNPAVDGHLAVLHLESIPLAGAGATSGKIVWLTGAVVEVQKQRAMMTLIKDAGTVVLEFARNQFFTKFHLLALAAAMCEVRATEIHYRERGQQRTKYFVDELGRVLHYDIQETLSQVAAVAKTIEKQMLNSTKWPDPLPHRYVETMSSSSDNLPREAETSEDADSEQEPMSNLRGPKDAAVGLNRDDRESAHPTGTRARRQRKKRQPR